MISMEDNISKGTNSEANDATGSSSNNSNINNILDKLEELTDAGEENSEANGATGSGSNNSNINNILDKLEELTDAGKEDSEANGATGSGSNNSNINNISEILEELTDASEEDSEANGATGCGSNINNISDILEELTGAGEEESSGSDRRWKQRCHIEEVPPMLRSDRRNKGCYDPKVVSIGPYHHGKKQLQMAEKLKPKVAQLFISGGGSSSRDRDMGLYLGKIREKVDDARSYYVDGSTVKYTDEKFAEMMLLDGCLVLALIKAPVSLDRRISGEIVKCLGMQGMYVLGTDIFYLLENQLPFMVLETLVSLRFPGDQLMKMLDDFCARLTFGVVGRNRKVKSNEIYKTRPHHLLEYFWLREREFDRLNNMVIKTRSTRTKQFIYSFRSISELKGKGIHIRPSNFRSRKAIEFKSFFFFGLLKLPPLDFTPEWIIRCSNLVAYELALNNPHRLPTMAYLNFMKSLINRPDDVRELRSKAVLFTTFSSDKEVVERFNSIITSAGEDFTVFDEVEERIQRFYRSRVKAWIAELIQNYFRSPWMFITFLAATSLLVLTFLQTYYTMFPRTSR